MQKHQISSFGKPAQHHENCRFRDCSSGSDSFYWNQKFSPSGSHRSAPKLNLKLFQFAACLELALKHVQRKQRRDRLWKAAQKEDVGEGVTFVFEKVFWRVGCQNISWERTALFWSLFHARQWARVLQVSAPEASQRGVILAPPASPYELLSWVMYMCVLT